MLDVTRIKCIVIGDPAVGKSAIIQTLVSDGTKFPKSYNLTFCVEVSSVVLKQPNSKNAELLIFDSSGHDIYSDMLLRIWKGASLLLLVYDVTSRQSLENTAAWLQMAKQAASANILCILFGNKTDLRERRQVTEEQGAAVARRLNVLNHIEGSARDFDGVQDAFNQLVQQIITP